MRTMDDLTLQYVLPLIIAVGEIGLIKEHSRALAGQDMHMLVSFFSRLEAEAAAVLCLAQLPHDFTFLLPIELLFGFLRVKYQTSDLDMRSHR